VGNDCLATARERRTRRMMYKDRMRRRVTKRRTRRAMRRSSVILDMAGASRDRGRTGMVNVGVGYWIV